MTKAIITTLALLLALPALAATECGQAGTGKVADGSTQTRTAEQAVGTQVRADGYWWTCNTVRPLLIQPPADCYPPDQGFRTWAVGEHTCTTANKYATSADHPARDGVIAHGRLKSWQQWQGTMRGRLAEACTDGVRRVVLAACGPVTHCDVQITIRHRGESYVYDGRGQGRVPVGGTAQAVSASGKTLPLQCARGDFRVMR